MPFNIRGQVSFEILLITAIVFAMTIWISSYYLAIKDTTLALQLTKIHALKQIDESDKIYTIERIDFEETLAEELILKIDTKGEPPFPATEFDCNGLKDTVSNSTKYKPLDKVIIRLDGSDCT